MTENKDNQNQEGGAEKSEVQKLTEVVMAQQAQIEALIKSQGQPAQAEEAAPEAVDEFTTYRKKGCGDLVVNSLPANAAKAVELGYKKVA